MKGRAAIGNFSYTLLATFMASVVTALSTLILPKFIGVEDFSYWQLYLFYVSYVGFLHFGWADGVYLRYGGRYYEELDKRLMSSQFWLMAIFETVVVMVVGLMAIFFVQDVNKELVLILVGVNCLLLNTRALLQFLLQGTNKIKIFARNVVIEKILLITFMFALIAVGAHDFGYFLGADIFAKLIMLITLCIACRDIVFARPIRNFGVSAREAWSNMSVGIKLLFANIASLLIVGLFRFVIESKWDIVTFGKVSLVLSIAGILMIFINAASIAIFPIIKRTPPSRLPEIYETLRTLLMVIVLGFLILCYPMQKILSLWLPEYAESLDYLFILLPLCIYETKNQLLINTYLKAFRKERYMLVVNIVSLLLGVAIVGVTAFIMHNLIAVLFGLIFVLAIRSILSEASLSKVLKINVARDIAYELCLTSIFIIASGLVGGIAGMSIYIITYLLYVIIKKRDILSAINLLKSKSNKNVSIASSVNL